ncbi:MAG: aminopeptidase [Bacilli bacterium]|nr:aminopeptidase [Bacilli bacterium]MBN2876287.1 aminopeptidase [Bacilli bacterium]
MNEILIRKLAKLAVKIGVNVQKGQYVFVNASTDSKEIAREVVKEAYLAGAGKVVVNWSDDYTALYGYEYRSVESLSEVAQWQVDKYRDFIEQNGAVITIKSPVPDLQQDVAPDKLQAYNIAMRKNLSFYYDHMMGSKSQWTIIAAANPIWAKKVFPNLEEDKALENLWKAILDASRVTMENDPIQDWNEHNARMLAHNKILNDYHFDTLYFKNKLGTDLSIKLVDEHIWAGGGEHTPEGLLFNPNIPTEENFTMPYKFGVNGKVVATKPLDYQGKLIEDFWLEFKDGKVVDYDARVNKEILENLLNFDEGSRYLGEIALISYDSPISNSGILFYNTLFDENASCHMALGRAYTINIKNGTNMTLEELKEKGYNHSMAHSDFMFGSEDLSIIGKTHDGKEVVIFESGNFVI